MQGMSFAGSLICHSWASTATSLVLEDERTRGSHGVGLQFSESHGFQHNWNHNRRPNIGYHHISNILYAESLQKHGDDIKADGAISGDGVNDFISGYAQEVSDIFQSNGLCLESEHVGRCDLINFSTAIRGVDYEQALASLLQQPDAPLIQEFVCVLQASRKLDNLAYARTLHMYACTFGLEHDDALGNYLVPMFAGCGSISDAQQVFFKLGSPNEYSWSALAQGFVDCGKAERAIDLYHNGRMVSSNFMLSALLKAYAILKRVKEGQELHAMIVKQGNDTEPFLGCSLVDTYAKCGFLIEALNVLERLPLHDVVPWTTVIAGFVEYGYFEEALGCLDRMQAENVHPNAVTYICSLKACARTGAVDMGYEIHAMVIKKSLESDLQLSNTLIDMYNKFYLVADAEQVFSSLAIRDVFSWTALVKGYCDNGDDEGVLTNLEKMQLDCVSPNAVTFSCLLKACKNLRAIEKGHKFHSKIVKEGYDGNLHIGTTLLDMYAECGLFEDAWQVFDMMPTRDTIPWNALIAAYANADLGHEAFQCLEQMQSEAVPQDTMTIIFSLKAASSTGSIERGLLIHNELVKDGVENDSFIGSLLIDVYAKYAYLMEAQEVFGELSDKDVVSWTAIIEACTEFGLNEQALEYFECMKLEDVPANPLTHAFVLKACGGIGDLTKGTKSHLGIIQQGLEKNLFVCNALICMYFRCGALSEALEVFETLPSRDMISWNLLIEGYVNHGLSMDALSCFDCMQQEGINANTATYVCALRACGSLDDLERGHEIHSMVVEEKLEKELFVGNCLVDMYGRCGSVAGARNVFEDLSIRDVVSWNALLSGYVNSGHGAEALVCFEQMHREGAVLPDSVTYIYALKACSNLGELKGGYSLHADILQKGFEVHSHVGSTLVGMYASCGAFCEAREVLYEIPVRNVVSWTALLAGYSDCGLVEEVQNVLQQMQSEGVPPNVITFTCSLKAFSGSGAQSRALEVMAEIVKRGYDKDIPCICTDADSEAK